MKRKMVCFILSIIVTVLLVIITVILGVECLSDGIKNVNQQTAFICGFALPASIMMIILTSILCNDIFTDIRALTKGSDSKEIKVM
jgi:ABC-type Na+ efflux pump permease subunit